MKKRICFIRTVQILAIKSDKNQLRDISTAQDFGAYENREYYKLTTRETKQIKQIKQIKHEYGGKRKWQQ